MRTKLSLIFLTLGIFLLAAFFRLYGVNWDQNHHLHPDERFLTMVSIGIDWPQNISEYFNTDSSPLNPHNRGFGFFVYGTFPIFFTKYAADVFNLHNYTDLTLLGRRLSALFDLGTVVFVFLIAKAVSELRIKNYELRKNKPTTYNLQPTTYFPLLSMFFYAISVLPIQLSHFYAVDTYLTFFLTLSFYLLVRIYALNSSKIKLTTYNLQLTTFLGISFGLALASKISAILFLPIIGLGFVFWLIKNKNFKLFLVLSSSFLVLSYFSFRLAQPYVFANQNIFDVTLNQKVLDNWKQLRLFDDPSGGFPPAVQWINTTPYLFPLKNMILWGLGLPLGIIAISAIGYQVLSIMYYVYKKKTYLLLNTYYLILGLSLLWILILFAYQGAQFVKAMRYFYPIYPFLAILSGWFVSEVFFTKKSAFQRTLVSLASLLIDWILNLAYFITHYKPLVKYKQSVKMPGVEPGRHGLRIQSSKPAIPTPAIIATSAFLLIIVSLYPLSFISIYSRPHTRVAASYWIYKNIPPGSTRSTEHWDDGLPLSLPETGFIHEKYKGVEFPLYGQDTLEKWQDMDKKLKQVDYIILSSNRLYGSIMTVPEKYPVTYRYYQMLFDGALGFKKIAEFTSRPSIPLPNFQFSIFNSQFSILKICLTPPLSHYGAIAKKTQQCDLPGLTFVDDYADETFTVYDHPKVIIFKKEREVDYFNIIYKNL